MAASASSCEPYVTNPKPRDRFVSLEFVKMHDIIKLFFRRQSGLGSNLSRITIESNTCPKPPNA